MSRPSTSDGRERAISSLTPAASADWSGYEFGNAPVDQRLKRLLHHGIGV